MAKSSEQREPINSMLQLGAACAINIQAINYRGSKCPCLIQLSKSWLIAEKYYIKNSTNSYRHHVWDGERDIMFEMDRGTLCSGRTEGHIVLDEYKCKKCQCILFKYREILQ